MSKKKGSSPAPGGAYELTIPARLSMMALADAITRGSRDQFRALDLAKAALEITDLEMTTVGIERRPDGKIFIPATLGDYRKHVELTPLARKTMTDVLVRLESEGNLDRRLVDAYDELVPSQATPAPEPEPTPAPAP